MAPDTEAGVVDLSQEAFELRRNPDQATLVIDGERCPPILADVGDRLLQPLVHTQIMQPIRDTSHDPERWITLPCRYRRMAPAQKASWIHFFLENILVWSS
jgi:hypothetical protein